MMYSRLQHVLTKIVTGVVTLSIVLATLYAPALTPQYAHAGGFSIVKDPWNEIVNTITSGATGLMASLTASLQVKEYVLDGIAFSVINMMIQQMSRDTIKWINSGFEGDPAFIQNMDTFLTGVGDMAVGKFLEGSELGSFLCAFSEPMKINIKVALEIQYAATRNFGAASNNTCSVIGIAENVERFMEGKMVMGSWNDWFKVTQSPQYNTYGAMLMAQEQMSMKISNSKGQQAEMLSWGKGMLSVQECARMDVEYSTGEEYCAEYRTVTPGTAIENSLNEALGAPGERIAVADEFNEIFAALFNQLVTQAFSGVGGLLGLTGGGSSGATNPYYTNLYAPGSGPSLTNLRTLIEKSIATEIEYRTANQSVVTKLEETADYKEDTYPGDSCHSGNLPVELQQQLDIAKLNILDANDNILVLNGLSAEYTAAGSDPDLQRIVMQKYSDLLASGEIHNAADTSAIVMGIPRLQQYINDFIAEVDSVCPSIDRDSWSGG